MTENTKKSDDIGFDDVAGDIFGLNIRGLQSIRCLITRPEDYAASARSADWHDRFTPSVRLWTSLVAMTVLLQFIWLADDSPMVRAFVEGFASDGFALPEGVTYLDFGRSAAAWSFALMPPLQIGFYTLLALLFRAWGRPTTIALRFRYLFAVIIPSNALMVFALPLVVFVPIAYVSFYGLLLALISFFIDARTARRGFMEGDSGRKRTIRAALLCGLILIANLGSSVIAQIVGIILTVQLAFAWG
ncbi:MAG: hypothetical protein HRU11_05720 [Parvularculaceae bacterium]|nr:hypothetical protein [Parvularculaceae bacterium]